MGAEAIRKLLVGRDLVKLSVDLRKDLSETNSKQKKKDYISRLKIVESIRDSENVPGPLSPEGLAKSEAPRFSQRLREDGMQRINALILTGGLVAVARNLHEGQHRTRRPGFPG